MHLVHKHFLVPSCTVDLTRLHPRPCLQYYIHRCLGPCAGLVTDERYEEAARDVRLFLEGRRNDLSRSLNERMATAASEERYEEAAGYRDLLRTLSDMEERQKIAATQGDDTDVLAWYAEPPQVAVNLFHLRGGRVVDRRDIYWENLDEFDPVGIPAIVAETALPRCSLSAALHSRPHGFRGLRAARGSPHRCRGTSRGNSEPPARPETRVLGIGREKREALLRAKISRLETKLESDCRSARIRPGPSRNAETNRVLRHLAHSGLRYGCLNGGLGRWADEKIRLQEIHHSWRRHAGGIGKVRRRLARRFREHARSGRTKVSAHPR